MKSRSGRSQAEGSTSQIHPSRKISDKDISGKQAV
ncbi:hypothetical protein chiPu_0027649, partial [Chiloscyllium punctatum]|nr:hypothetical protein [Chiloscyllium punctatum]